MGNKQEYAARLLGYYMRLIARKSGISWDEDNDTEVAEIIDAIFAEFGTLRQEVERLKDRIEEMEDADNLAESVRIYGGEK